MTTTTSETGTAPDGTAPGRPRALVIAHEVHGRAVTDELGTLGDRLAHHGITIDVVTSGARPFPDPTTVNVVCVTGSDRSAYDDTVPWLPAELAYLRQVIDVGTPILGICFGGQILSRALGGTVRRAERAELGWYEVDTADPALIPPGPWMESHWDRFTVPPGATRLASTADADQAFAHGPHLGIQFHPEITPTAFAAWEASWRANGHDRTVAAKGVDLDALRAEIARNAPASRAASFIIFDRFWERARAHNHARRG